MCQENDIWFKSSYSGGEGNECVEIANFRTHVAVRDSKNLAQGALKVSADCFAMFVSGMAT
ncbi:DUF397 domain-containing protein [Streptomyces endophyticus]|uniref:DUF397 domain-containing protein n=1 Tax=Streptomyces endophyticus TaxID=714166 RepID=A0ABU6FFS2_9ACTN|nr:DUF397 domain-containing protein [Streptomyces endophyticus]MEB8342694.1 DUF397 domain-containing protein [Streptomyces endophyticus]